MKKYTVAASTLLLALSSAAFAQSSDTPEFSEVDANADGQLNKQEADQALPALGLTDSNQDGVISKGDVKKVLPDIDFEEGDEAAVGETEYEQIVQVLDAMMGRAG